MASLCEELRGDPHYTYTHTHIEKKGAGGGVKETRRTAEVRTNRIQNVEIALARDSNTYAHTHTQRPVHNHV